MSYYNQLPTNRRNKRSVLQEVLQQRKAVSSLADGTPSVFAQQLLCEAEKTLGWSCGQVIGYWNEAQVYNCCASWVSMIIKLAANKLDCDTKFKNFGNIKGAKGQLRQAIGLPELEAVQNGTPNYSAPEVGSVFVRSRTSATPAPRQPIANATQDWRGHTGIVTWVHPSIATANPDDIVIRTIEANIGSNESTLSSVGKDAYTKKEVFTSAVASGFKGFDFRFIQINRITCSAKVVSSDCGTETPPCPPTPPAGYVLNPHYPNSPQQDGNSTWIYTTDKCFRKTTTTTGGNPCTETPMPSDSGDDRYVYSSWERNEPPHSPQQAGWQYTTPDACWRRQAFDKEEKPCEGTPPDGFVDNPKYPYNPNYDAGKYWTYSADRCFRKERPASACEEGKEALPLDKPGYAWEINPDGTPLDEVNYIYSEQKCWRARKKNVPPPPPKIEIPPCITINADGSFTYVTNGNCTPSGNTSSWSNNGNNNGNSGYNTSYPPLPNINVNVTVDSSTKTPERITIRQECSDCDTPRKRKNNARALPLNDRLTTLYSLRDMVQQGITPVMYKKPLYPQLASLSDDGNGTTTNCSNLVATPCNSDSTSIKINIPSEAEMMFWDVAWKQDPIAKSLLGFNSPNIDSEYRCRETTINGLDYQSYFPIFKMREGTNNRIIIAGDAFAASNRTEYYADYAEEEKRKNMESTAYDETIKRGIVSRRYIFDTIKQFKLWGANPVFIMYDRVQTRFTGSGWVENVGWKAFRPDNMGAVSMDRGRLFGNTLTTEQRPEAYRKGRQLPEQELRQLFDSGDFSRSATFWNLAQNLENYCKNKSNMVFVFGMYGEPQTFWAQYGKIVMMVVAAAIQVIPGLGQAAGAAIMASIVLLEKVITSGTLDFTALATALTSVAGALGKADIISADVQKYIEKGANTIATIVNATPPQGGGFTPKLMATLAQTWGSELADISDALQDIPKILQNGASAITLFQEGNYAELARLAGITEKEGIGKLAHTVHQHMKGFSISQVMRTVGLQSGVESMLQKAIDSATGTITSVPSLANFVLSEVSPKAIGMMPKAAELLSGMLGTFPENYAKSAEHHASFVSLITRTKNSFDNVFEELRLEALINKADFAARNKQAFALPPTVPEELRECYAREVAICVGGDPADIDPSGGGTTTSGGGTTTSGGGTTTSGGGTTTSGGGNSTGSRPTSYSARATMQNGKTIWQYNDGGTWKNIPDNCAPPPCPPTNNGGGGNGGGSSSSNSNSTSSGGSGGQGGGGGQAGAGGQGGNAQGGNVTNNITGGGSQQPIIVHAPQPIIVPSAPQPIIINTGGGGGTTNITTTGGTTTGGSGGTGSGGTGSGGTGSGGTITTGTGTGTGTTGTGTGTTTTVVNEINRVNEIDRVTERNNINNQNVNNVDNVKNNENIRNVDNVSNNTNTLTDETRRNIETIATANNSISNIVDKAETTVLTRQDIADIRTNVNTLAQTNNTNNTNTQSVVSEIIKELQQEVNKQNITNETLRNIDRLNEEIKLLNDISKESDVRNEQYVVTNEHIRSVESMVNDVKNLTNALSDTRTSTANIQNILDRINESNKNNQNIENKTLISDIVSNLKESVSENRFSENTQNLTNLLIRTIADERSTVQDVLNQNNQNNVNNTNTVNTENNRNTENNVNNVNNVNNTTNNVNNINNVSNISNNTNILNEETRMNVENIATSTNTIDRITDKATENALNRQDIITLRNETDNIRNVNNENNVNTSNVLNEVVRNLQNEVNKNNLTSENIRNIERLNEEIKILNEISRENERNNVYNVTNEHIKSVENLVSDVKNLTNALTDTRTSTATIQNILDRINESNKSNNNTENKTLITDIVNKLKESVAENRFSDTTNNLTNVLIRSVANESISVKDVLRERETEKVREQVRLTENTINTNTQNRENIKDIQLSRQTEQQLRTQYDRQSVSELQTKVDTMLQDYQRMVEYVTKNIAIAETNIDNATTTEEFNKAWEEYNYWHSTYMQQVALQRALIRLLREYINERITTDGANRYDTSDNRRHRKVQTANNTRTRKQRAQEQEYQYDDDGNCIDCPKVVEEVVHRRKIYDNETAKHVYNSHTPRYGYETNYDNDNNNNASYNDDDDDCTDC